MVEAIERTDEQEAIERRARAANRADLWDGLWQQRGQVEWRREALNRVHTRIERLIPLGARVLDVGGGPGEFAKRLVESRDADVTVWDISPVAIEQARAQRGVRGEVVDLEKHSGDLLNLAGSWVVATEVLEHLSADARNRLIKLAALACVDAPEFTAIGIRKMPAAGFLVSVPNHRLGPEEEHQHTVSFTAVTLAAELRRHFEHVRVEALGPFLLGVCGAPARKGFKLAVTLPVRDEEHDLEATLATYRGIADVLVVGVDPRTVDRTREVAALYADDVFDFVDPEGPPEERVPAGGVHFSHARNQCIERCKAHGAEWVFMTEGHERLVSGEDILLQLDRVVGPADVVFVMREGDFQRWAFPWVFRAKEGIKFRRPTHNVLDYPAEALVVTVPAIRTLHERHHDNAKQRAGQRKVQNRATLLDDWERNGNLASLFYLGQECRGDDPEAAVGYLDEFLRQPAKDGAARYQARLMLSKIHVTAGRKREAREALIPAAGDDWSRTEHFIRLGDLAFLDGRLEEALQFYRYAGTGCGEPPLTVWWIDLACYSYLPAQRLAMAYGHLGRGDDALAWARKVYDMLPDDAPAAAFDEARANIRALQAALRDIRAEIEAPQVEVVATS